VGGGSINDKFQIDPIPWWNTSPVGKKERGGDVKEKQKRGGKKKPTKSFISKRNEDEKGKFHIWPRPSIENTIGDKFMKKKIHPVVKKEKTAKTMLIGTTVT